MAVQDVSTAAGSSAWADYLFVHEFGHHFAALADDYYTSPVAYQSGEECPEPWEPNVTALFGAPASDVRSQRALLPSVPGRNHVIIDLYSRPAE